MLKWAVCVAAAAACAAGLHPFATLANVRAINSGGALWRASVTSPMARLTEAEARALFSLDVDAAHNDPANPPAVDYHAGAFAVDAPETFDAREQWPNCKSMSQIRDQASCGSCWAFGAVEPMSDRECIARGHDVILSAEDMNSCSGAGSCNGGYPSSAYSYYQRTGVVTEACRPYSIPGCDHHIPGSKNPCPSGLSPTPKCVKACVNGDDWDKVKYRASKVYTVRGEANMMTELSTNGPCEAAFQVYSDFLTYTSGIYHHISGTYQGGHAIRILGYGVENGNKYWILANSWNPNWGEKGYFRMLRGSNECGIESTIWCGLPQV